MGDIIPPFGQYASRIEFTESRCSDTNSRRAISSLCSDLISDKDSGSRVEDVALPKFLKSVTLILAKTVFRCRFKIQRSGERNVRTNRRNHGWRAQWPPDSHGKPGGLPGSTGPLRLLRSVNDWAARYALFMVPIVLTGCQPAV